MNIPARLSFSPVALSLAGFALLGGCNTRWAQLDEDFMGGPYRRELTLETECRISTLRPGQTSLEEVEKSIGRLKVLASFDPQHTDYREHGTHGRTWSFYFSKEGVLQSFARNRHSFHMVFTDKASAEDFDRWYEDRLGFSPVSPERAQGFKPGATRLEHVVAAWGECESAQVLDSGGFATRWGSNRDSWCLEFDSAGVLTRDPRHDVH